VHGGQRTSVPRFNGIRSLDVMVKQAMTSLVNLIASLRVVPSDISHSTILTHGYLDVQDTTHPSRGCTKTPWENKYHWRLLSEFQNKLFRSGRSKGPCGLLSLVGYSACCGCDQSDLWLSTPNQAWRKTESYQISLSTLLSSCKRHVETSLFSQFFTS